MTQVLLQIEMPEDLERSAPLAVELVAADNRPAERAELRSGTARVGAVGLDVLDGLRPMPVASPSGENRGAGGRSRSIDGAELGPREFDADAGVDVAHADQQIEADS